MIPKNLISISDFCTSHQISRALIVAFRSYGLIQIVEQKDNWYLSIDELPKAEKILRLHAELDVNLEGIEVITQLLIGIEDMQSEIIRLRNRLALYE